MSSSVIYLSMWKAGDWCNQICHIPNYNNTLPACTAKTSALWWVCALWLTERSLLTYRRTMRNVFFLCLSDDYDYSHKR